MSNYYYLAAQLPFLQFARWPEVTTENFLNEARKWLSKENFAVLENVNIDNFISDKTDTYVLKEYKRFDYRVKEEISFFRKADSDGRSYKLSSKLREVFTVDDPLEREKLLLYLRWKIIEEKESGHYFDLDFLTAYFLKMQILQRLFTFNKDNGLRLFDEVCEVKYE
ncbi:MAG: DUF2764 family protein [Candidatus Omnitrophota bacterium]|nr:DUF2764 domain-containing protein [Candidatus Omnitrophota bacterium]